MAATSLWVTMLLGAKTTWLRTRPKLPSTRISTSSSSPTCLLTICLRLSPSKRSTNYSLLSVKSSLSSWQLREMIPLVSSMPTSSTRKLRIVKTRFVLSTSPGHSATLLSMSNFGWARSISSQRESKSRRSTCKSTSVRPSSTSGMKCSANANPTLEAAEVVDRQLREVVDLSPVLRERPQRTRDLNLRLSSLLIKSPSPLSQHRNTCKCHYHQLRMLPASPNATRWMRRSSISVTWSILAFRRPSVTSTSARSLVCWSTKRLSIWTNL